MDSKKYIVFLDLDGTICSINSGYALVRTARTKNLIGIVGIAKAVAYSLLYKLHLAPAERIIGIMGRWIRGMKHETLSAISAEAAEKYLIDSVFREAYDEIIFHRSQNAELAILSSAIGEICRPLASHLGIDHTICTEMETKDGLLTGSSLGGYCFGEEKKRQIISFCRENGFDPADAFYYADSFSDMAALEATGNPVCVNPDSKLRKKALEKSWQVRSWKNSTGKK
jgi:HAD superfamily hydrolase (TIGR01490 family)